MREEGNIEETKGKQNRRVQKYKLVYGECETREKQKI